MLKYISNRIDTSAKGWSTIKALVKDKSKKTAYWNFPSSPSDLYFDFDDVIWNKYKAKLMKVIRKDELMVGWCQEI